MPLIEEEADLVSVVPSSARVHRAAPESRQDRLEGTAACWVTNSKIELSLVLTMGRRWLTSEKIEDG